MARTSRQQAQAKAEARTREIAEAMNILTKPMRTKRIQPMKDIYWLLDDDTHTTIIALREYTNDLAIMASIRKLSWLKERNAAPKRAILVKGIQPETGEYIQGFKRT